MFTKCLPLWITGLLILLLGCASSKDDSQAPEELSNLVEVVKPEKGKGRQPSQIYIDSVRIIHPDERTSLLIMGSFPDGCTHIGGASHSITEGSVVLTLDVWRDPEQMCTQSLVSFSFIYSDLPEQRLHKTASLRINGKQYTLKE